VSDERASVAALREHMDEAGIDLDVNEWLDAIEGETDFQEAIEEVAKAILEIDGQIAGVRHVETTLKGRRDRLERSKDSLRGVILAAMDKAGIEKIQRPIVTISAEDKPREIGPMDEALIPARFFEPQPPKLDKKALREALRGGEDVPGATLDNGGRSLTMRYA